MLFHLPSIRATPLLLLLLLLGCLGVAWGGSLRNGRGRTPTTPNDDSGRAPPMHKHHNHHHNQQQQQGERRDVDPTPLAVTIAESQQRALLKNGKRLGGVQMPDDLVGQHRPARHNGTVVQQQQQQQQPRQQMQRRRTRLVKRQASPTSCEIREEVVYYHQGECVTIAGLDFCETDLYLDLGNSDCT